MVQVRYVSPNSRWYSGAGIYRSVYLTETNKTHILWNGVYVTANAENGSVHVDTEAVGEYDSVAYTVFDADGNIAAELKALILPFRISSFGSSILPLFTRSVQALSGTVRYLIRMKQTSDSAA